MSTIIKLKDGVPGKSYRVVGPDTYHVWNASGVVGYTPPGDKVVVAKNGSQANLESADGNLDVVEV